MGRAGGSCEIKNGKKKQLEQTKDAEPVSGKATRIEEQAAANKSSANKAAAKG